MIRIPKWTEPTISDSVNMNDFGLNIEDFEDLCASIAEFNHMNNTTYIRPYNMMVVFTENFKGSAIVTGSIVGSSCRIMELKDTSIHNILNNLFETNDNKYSEGFDNTLVFFIEYDKSKLAKADLMMNNLLDYNKMQEFISIFIALKESITKWYLNLFRIGYKAVYKQFIESTFFMSFLVMYGKDITKDELRTMLNRLYNKDFIVRKPLRSIYYAKIINILKSKSLNIKIKIIDL